jgi:hypothetical protein
MAKLSPVFNWGELISGVPASGAKVFTYAAGSSTKQTTYTDEDGLTAQANPIILNARGEPDNPIYLTEGQSYKLVLAPSTDTDPPTAAIRTIDDVEGVNDSGNTTSQWTASGLTPTYVSATQFTVPGDRTSTLTVNRRLKLTVTAGTVYGYITASAYTTLTTVTVDLDASGALDSGLSAVELGIITPTNTSLRVTNTMIAPMTSAQLRAIVSDETGSGLVMFNQSPTFAAGTATAGTAMSYNTAGTLLTVAEANANEYDGTAHFKTIDTTSGRAQECNQHIFRLTANGSAIGPTIADFFGANSAFPTVTNGVYEIEYHLYFTKQTGGTITYTLTNTQTYTNLAAWYEHTAVGGLSSYSGMNAAGITAATTAASDLPVTGSVSNGAAVAVIIHATVECGTAGNIRLRVTSSAGTVTPLRGSYYTVRRLYAGNVGTFAA